MTTKLDEIECLKRENAALARAYAACEQMLRQRTEQLNHADAEVARMQAIVDAAFAYVHTPIDDPATGLLYRALQSAVTETVVAASMAARRQA